MFKGGHCPSEEVGHRGESCDPVARCRSRKKDQCYVVYLSGAGAVTSGSGTRYHHSNLLLHTFGLVPLSPDHDPPSDKALPPPPLLLDVVVRQDSRQRQRTGDEEGVCSSSSPACPRSPAFAANCQAVELAGRHLGGSNGPLGGKLRF